MEFYGTLLDPIELDGISGNMSSEIQNFVGDSFQKDFWIGFISHRLLERFCYLRMLEFLKISSFRYLHTR